MSYITALSNKPHPPFKPPPPPLPPPPLPPPPPYYLILSNLPFSLPLSLFLPLTPPSPHQLHLPYNDTTIRASGVHGRVLPVSLSLSCSTFSHYTTYCQLPMLVCLLCVIYPVCDIQVTQLHWVGCGLWCGHPSKTCGEFMGHVLQHRSEVGCVLCVPDTVSRSCTGASAGQL